MKLVLVHGWSVTSKDTYGGLPAALRALAPSRGLQLDVVDVRLGRYISFRDEVRMDDLERAFDRALRDALPGPAGGIAPFSCITHSTGAPVVRCWLDRYYGSGRLRDCPLEHLIMLAPPNHGSALAALGKATVGRLKAWAEGMQPGVQILDWLELGSDGQRRLNRRWLDYDLASAHGAGSRFFPVVLTGETIDRKLYDFVNSYTGEPGSDGVVRAAAANLHAHWLTLRQTDEPVRARGLREATRLVLDGGVRAGPATPFRVIPGAAHSGAKLGILRSPTVDNAADKPVVGAILDALAIRDGAGYAALAAACARETEAEQARPTDEGPRRRYFQMVIHVSDDEGRAVTDFDLVLLAGPAYDPNALPRGFLRDRQKNRRSGNTVVFYLDYGAMMAVPAGRFGLRVVARPDDGFAYYTPAEFHSDTRTIDEVVDPNTTVYLDVVLRRRVDREAARLDPEQDGYGSFKATKPSGVTLP